ncbi:MAG: polysaccharide deacetylase family protein [Planctomycetota bacterium]
MKTTQVNQSKSASRKPLASVSLDLDNKWSYLKTQGSPDWESFPSYFDVAVPRFLEFLDKRNLKITVFVIGQDAVLEKNHASIKMIAEAGHEIANHSFNHEPWLHLYSPDQINDELGRTEAAIKSLTGQKTVGFRGPGFSCSDQVLKALMRRGYLYDASTFPTFLGPLARAYTFFKSRLSRKQKEERKGLFGSWRDGFQSNHPFCWTDPASDQQSLLEIPVTTLPLFKVPIHGSYYLYLAGYSTTLARSYFWTAVKMCRMMGVQPSLLLHPTDFLGCDDEPDLSFFPAMNQPSKRKCELMSDALKWLSQTFECVTMREHAESVSMSSMKRRAITTAAKGIETLNPATSR